MLTSSPEARRFEISKEDLTSRPSVRFVIRGEGHKEREEAVREFESESDENARAAQMSVDSSSVVTATSQGDRDENEPSVSSPETHAEQPKKEEPAATLARYLVNSELLQKNGELEMAKVLLREILNKEPRNELALQRMLSLLNQQAARQPSSEERWLERHVIAKALDKLSPSTTSAASLAQLYVEKGDLDKALDGYFRAASLINEENSTVFEVYKDIGNIYVRLRDFDGAEEYYHKAFAMNPDSDVLHVNLGTLEIQREAWGQAADRFRTALSINSKNDKAWVGLALAHHHLSDFELAFANLKSALDLKPDNRTAVHLLAAWGQKHGRVEEAIQALQNYLSKVSFDEEMSLALIELLCEVQKYSLASFELERVLCWNPHREDLVELENRLKDLVAAEALLSTAPVEPQPGDA